MKKVLLMLLALCCLLSTAHAEDSIKLGVIFTLSGWGAEHGHGELNAATMASEDINKSGGIKGKKLELVVEDNRSEAKETASAFRKLIAVDRVKGIVGPNWTEFTEVVTPIANAERVPFISPSGYKKGLFKENSYAFTLWPPHENATKVLADYLISRGHKNLTVIVEANAYYDGIYEALSGQLNGSQVKLEDVVRINEMQRDFKSLISKIKNSKSDGVIAFLLENADENIFLKQARELKLTLPIYAANSIPYDTIVQSNPSIAEGVIYFDYVVLGSSEFKKRFKERFRLEPNHGSAKAYDAVYLYKQAIEECGEESSAIRRCLAKIHYNGLSGAIHFSSKGAIEVSGKSTSLFQVKNAQFVPLGSVKK